MFQFSCRFAFFISFSSFKPDDEITQILTLHQANAPTLAPFSKEDKISVVIILSYTVLKLVRFFETQCSCSNSCSSGLK